MSSRVIYGIISVATAVLVKISSTAHRALFFIEPYLEVWRNKYVNSLEVKADEVLVRHEQVIDEYYTRWQKAVESATLRRDRQFKRISNKVL